MDTQRNRWIGKHTTFEQALLRPKLGLSMPTPSKPTQLAKLATCPSCDVLLQSCPGDFRLPLCSIS